MSIYLLLGIVYTLMGIIAFQVFRIIRRESRGHQAIASASSNIPAPASPIPEVPANPTASR